MKTCPAISIVKVAISKLEMTDKENKHEAQFAMMDIFAALKHVFFDEIPEECYVEYRDLKNEFYKLAFTKFGIREV